MIGAVASLHGKSYTPLSVVHELQCVNGRLQALLLLLLVSSVRYSIDWRAEG